MEHAIDKIHQRLKEFRSARGFSLDDLAKRSGVSRAMLSNIERGMASPTIGLLSKITTALGIPLTRLVADQDTERPRVIRKEEMRALADTVSGVTRTSLSTELADWGLELVRYELPAGSTTGDCGSGTSGIREIIHMTKGEVDVKSEATCTVIREGDTYLHEATGESFQISNHSKTPACFYLVLDRRGVRVK